MTDNLSISLLTRIAEALELGPPSKESFYIKVDDNSTRIVTRFNPLIQLKKNKNYEMAMVNLETYYSFPNIDSSNNKFKYSPNNGATWVTIAIPEGSYEIEDINSYIQMIMKNNDHYDAGNEAYTITISANNNTLRSVLTISTDYKVDFTIGSSIRTVLGFNSQVYSEGRNESENVVNILSVNSISVTNDIIGSSYLNGSTDNIIYSFFPNVSPGFKIVQEPHNLIYLPVTLKTISKMVTELKDQTGKLLNLRGESVGIRYHVREC